ncbi:MAG: hypothetical protein F6K24_03825 [Okeania sp. SIO2D1]|nr:hypothetical protein [Okeania sp. SIO2D1]
MFNYRQPKQPKTTITPNNYGYSHCFIDDDSQMLLEWEQNSCIPTPELAAKAKNAASSRGKQAAMSKQIRRDLAKVSKANAEIIKNFAAAKTTTAQGNKRQFDSYSNMFNGMDKLEADYELSKARRSQRLAEIKASYQDSVANLRSNSNHRQRAAAASRN